MLTRFNAPFLGTLTLGLFSALALLGIELEAPKSVTTLPSPYSYSVSCVSGGPGIIVAFATSSYDYDPSLVIGAESGDITFSKSGGGTWNVGGSGDAQHSSSPGGTINWSRTLTIGADDPSLYSVTVDHPFETDDTIYTETSSASCG